MGKASIKENKNIYQLCREELKLTRKEASEKIPGMEDYRLEKIENDVRPTPDEVYNMANAYGKPELCRYYCAKECRIGIEENKKEIQLKELPQITLMMLDSLRKMNDTKDSMIGITADGEISDEELEDFCDIQNELSEMQENIEVLKMWTEKMLSTGKINQEKYKKIMDAKSNSLKK